MARRLSLLVLLGASAREMQAQGSKVPMPSGAPVVGAGLGVLPASTRARVLLERDTVTGEGLLAVRVRVVGQGFVVASYQGVVKFDASGGTVLKTSTASNEEGQSLLNVDAAAPGVLKYAGFSARGYSRPTVKVGRIVFRAASLSRLRLTATLDVVGDPEGKSVPVRQRANATGVTSPVKAR